ncbi:eukaryotic initiation factor [Dunaliella salina]|uniref:Eukaryotic translation initiation factor 3 subunit A n=1 Tax=Dunaliella salina TaxID=3046 RepID=A0ABQ7FZI5_DUNSA|nr:eukaryotic initiation factor [Dunaliella salina]|eukprot:KAF5827767.1 eukaryotic initiation factor [Dunaliella salina]
MYRRGPVSFARPENALKRAEELENVGQKGSALQALHDIVTSKKHRTWSKTHEAIMLKHLDLVVEMKKRNYAKEALMQYRNMCQAVNINSLEEVIKYFLKKTSDKAEEAQSKAAAATLDVEDLEQDASPEDIMLSYVSGDKSKDRTDRELVTPWFRFLWESYRSVLEILRTNPKLEALYAMIANKAFQFCLQYRRTAEFRRLCDILRQHLMNLTNRYRENRDASPDQLQVHMETRFEQLKVACELELWAEAFRSVEDIQALIALAKKAPKQQLMATYYSRLTQIFAVSKNHMYHAYAWLKLFNFSKSFNKNMTPQDLQMMACSVLLATLSILPYDAKAPQHDEYAVEQEKERILRMANILGFAVDSKKDYRTVLSRAALLGSIQALNILNLVVPEVRQIFDLFTAEFSPLELCSRLAPLLARLQEMTQPMSPASPVKDVALGQYVDSLKQVAVLRLLKQLSEVYSTMRISTLAELVPFMPFSEVEGVVVDAVKSDYLQVRIDHRNGTLHFGSQQLENERVRGHMALLGQRLSKVLHIVKPASSPSHEERRNAIITHAMNTLEKDHGIYLARKLIIEKRKEEQELALVEAEKEEERRRAIAAREAEVAEEKRRREEALRREKERIERELEERELEEAKALYEASKRAKAGAGAKGAAGGPPERLDKRTLMQEAFTERMREQQELERKLVKLAKAMDHLERAHREEETPLIQQAAHERIEEERRAWMATQHEDEEKQRTQWQQEITYKQQLQVTQEDKAVFQAQVYARRQEEFAALRHAHERQLQVRKEQLRHERMMERRRAFLERCKRQVAAKVAQVEAEEEERAAARRKQEEEERNLKVQEEIEREKKREGEVQARLREQREKEDKEKAATPAPGKFLTPAQRARLAAEQGGAVPAAAAPAKDDGDRWGRREPPPAPAAAPPREAPRPAAPTPAPGKFIPPHLRRQMQ